MPLDSLSMASLYRKHRPRTFADVVGQEHIVRTLQAAVEQDRVAHAYLFAGPRGTGKTSLAKILAKALNCEHGPTPTPDGTCERCMAIHEARSLDVIELDAASNRGIDTIRETVIERASLAPIEGGRKIYILDEAHSLTADASNALLKTLEEPPEKVVFILCTTDAGKLLPTVRSRCQRFAFRRPGPGELATVLRRISDAEGIEADDAALHLMARAAGGSFRDAVGTLDQLATVTHGAITADEAARVLGLVPEQALSDVVDLIADADAGGLLRRVDELASGGQDLASLVPALLERLRLLYLLQHAGELPSSAEPPPDRLEDLRRQARALPEGETVRTIDLLVVAQSELREGSDPRLSLELALLKATRPAVAGRDLLLARIERLEASLAGNGAPAPAPAPPPAPAPAPAASTPAPEAPPWDPEPAPPVAPEPPAPPAAPAPHVHVPIDGPADLDALRDSWGGVLRRLEPVMRVALDPSEPAVLNGSALIVNVRGSMLAVASRYGEALGHAIAEECGVRVSPAFAAAATMARPEAVTESDEDEPELEPPVGGEALAARLLNEFDAHEEQD
jgi:DNA polymerase III subunit gamma/tau